MKNNWTRQLIICLGVAVVMLLVSLNGNAQKLEKSLLWEVSGNDIETSYVYGTFHLLPQKDFELKEKVTAAFDGADLIVMELDMDDPNMQAELMKSTAMKDGQTLDQLLDETDYKKVDQLVKASVGIGLKQMNTFKPFFVSSMLIPSLIEGTPASYEMTFTQRAISAEKEIKGLETATEQALVFDKIPYEDQAEDLMDIVNEREKMSDLFSKMVNYYKEEDVDSMYDLFVEYTGSEIEEKYLLSDRNENWIPKIGEYSKDQSVFYGVGAAHLAGEKGVINLLKAAGYQVKPIL